MAATGRIYSADMLIYVFTCLEYEFDRWLIFTYCTFKPFVMTMIVQMDVRTDDHHINSLQSEPFSVMNRLNVPESKKKQKTIVSHKL